MIRIGIIGAGPNGTGHVKKLMEHRNRCHISGIADTDSSKAKELAALADTNAYTDFNQMFDDTDAVIISTPNFLHTQHAIACASAGKHVWIEKPMALSIAEADRIVDVVEASHVKSFVGFSVRFSDVIRTMKKRYQQGMAGEIVSIWARRMHGINTKPRTSTWRNQFTKSGGFISEIVSHELDWITDIAGTPDSIYCRIISSNNEDPRNNDHVWLMLGFDNGATGTIEGGCYAQYTEHFRGIAGTKGALYSQNWGNELWYQRSPKEADPLSLEPPLDKHIHFLDILEDRCESMANVHVGRSIVQLTEKALESAAKSTVVSN